MAEVTALCAVMQMPYMDIAHHPFTTLHALIPCWLLETGHGLGIYIMEIDKWYKIELLNFFQRAG